MRSVLLTRKFWAATAERAVRTAAQAAIGAIGTTAVVIGDVQWEIVAGTTGLATVLSVLTAVAASGTSSEGPAFGSAEQLKDAA